MEERDIADVLFDKTKKNLLENLGVADEAPGKRAPRGYQLKGQAMIFTDGEIIEGVEKRMRY